MIEFTVPGRPVPAVRMTQRSKYTKQAQRYLKYKNHVGWVARSHMQGSPTDKAVGVNLSLYLSGGNQGDIDNYFKAITDSINKIVYKDDRQIRIMKAKKVECQKADERVEVEVYELDELTLMQIG